MNNDNEQLKGCKDDPSLIFNYIKMGRLDIVDLVIEKNIVSVNTLDNAGNDVVTRLLKAEEYERVLKYMKKRNWNCNHQNLDGNTFGHILASDNSVRALKVVEQLTKNKKYIPNIKNNKGETVLDRAINSNYIYTAIKILEDRRFNNIDVMSFKNLFDTYVKNSYYGKYSKINNLEIIVDSLEKKDSLLPGMKRLLDEITDNMDYIKKEIINNRVISIDKMISSSLVTA